MPITVDQQYREKIRRLDIIEGERNEFEKQAQTLRSRNEELKKDADKSRSERDGFQKQAVTLKSRNQDLMKKVEELVKVAADAKRENPDVAEAVKKAESDLAEMKAKYDPLVEQNEKLKAENEKLKIKIKVLPSSRSSRPSAIILFIAVFLVFLPFSRPLQSLYGVLQISDYSWFLRCLDLFIALQLGLFMIWVYSKIKKAQP